MAYVNVLSGLSDSLANSVKNLKNVLKKPSKEQKLDNKKDQNEFNSQKLDGLNSQLSNITAYLQSFAITQSHVTSTVVSKLEKIEQRVEYLNTRLSPRVLMIGKGKNAQSVRFDPLAPQGKQVTYLTSGGKAGAFASKKGGITSDYEIATTKIARGTVTEPVKTVETKKERSALYKRLAYEPSEDDPVMILKKSMEKNFKKIFESLEEIKATSGGDGGGVGSGTLAFVAKLLKYLPRSAIATLERVPALAATIALAQSINEGMKEGGNKAVINVVKDVTKEQERRGFNPESSYPAYKQALETSWNATPMDKREFSKQTWLYSSELSNLEKSMAKRYFQEIKEPTPPAAADSKNLGKSATDQELKAISETGTSEEAMKFFQDKGWSKAQAAGIVGNLYMESRLKTDALGDNKMAYGIAQWHPARQANFNSEYKKDIRQSTFKEQLEFVNWELNNGEYKNAGDSLRKAKNPADAAYIVDKRYERSKGYHTKKRMDYANKLFGKETSALPTPTPPAKHIKSAPSYGGPLAGPETAMLSTPAKNISGKDISTQSATIADTKTMLASVSQPVVINNIAQTPPAQQPVQQQNTMLPIASVDDIDKSLKTSFNRDRWA